MSQTAYNTAPAAGYAGLEVDSEPARKLQAINEEVASIPFGVALVRGTDGDKAKLPAAASDALKLLGIALSTYWQDNRELSSNLAVKAGDVCNVIEEGAVWVLAEQDVVKGDPVFMRIATSGGNTQLGKLRKDVDSGTAVRLRGAVFDSTGVAGAPVKVRLRAPLGGSDEGFMWSAAHAQVTATTVVPLFQNRSDRHLLIKGLKYFNATGLVADATNFFAITVENAANDKTFGTWSTETGEEGSAGAGEYEALTLGPDLVVAPGEAVELVLTEGGTATLPAGTIFLEGEYL
jgi:hypothetical protein